MTDQDHKQALPPGFRLGSYRVVRVLGAGGFGITYLCEHAGLGVQVAVKEYLPNEIAVRDGTAVQPKSAGDREGFEWGLSRFLDEAKTLARFKHPNVVRVRDCFEANCTAYIVMDYEDGESLDRLLQRLGTQDWLARLDLPASSDADGCVQPRRSRVEGRRHLRAADAADEDANASTRSAAPPATPQPAAEGRTLNATAVKVLVVCLALAAAGVAIVGFDDGLDLAGTRVAHTPLSESEPPVVRPLSLQALAERGDPDAQLRLGTKHYNGDGVAKDAREAARWYKKAAEQGDATGQHNLGALYAHGKGVPKDAGQAGYWYRKAAEQGDALAQAALARLYRYGDGVPKDAIKAVRWFRKAAEQGDMLAQTTLGLMYNNGEGVAMDAHEAARWYRQAAEQGEPLAQVLLALYEDGEGDTPPRPQSR